MSAGNILETLEVLPEFDGMAVHYEPRKNPYFKSIVLETLRDIQKTSAGKKLLKLIADARPFAHKDTHIGEELPPSINVVLKPLGMTYVQKGFKIASAFDDGAVKGSLIPSKEKKHNPDVFCSYRATASSANSAFDPMAASNPKQGSVCRVHFANMQVTTSQGEIAYPHIVLAHELIHSWHCLYGINAGGQDEELWTSGVGMYRHSELTENVFRNECGYALRLNYY